MGAAFFGVLLTLLATGPARAGELPAQADRVVDYQIGVKLDPATRRLTGTERVTWRNPSKEPVSFA